MASDEDEGQEPLVPMNITISFLNPRDQDAFRLSDIVSLSRKETSPECLVQTSYITMTGRGVLHIVVAPGAESSAEDFNDKARQALVFRTDQVETDQWTDRLRFWGGARWGEQRTYVVKALKQVWAEGDLGWICVKLMHKMGLGHKDFVNKESRPVVVQHMIYLRSEDFVSQADARAMRRELTALRKAQREATKTSPQSVQVEAPANGKVAERRRTEVDDPDESSRRKKRRSSPRQYSPLSP